MSLAPPLTGPRASLSNSCSDSERAPPRARASNRESDSTLGLPFPGDQRNMIEIALVKFDVDASYDGEINPEPVLDFHTAP